MKLPIDVICHFCKKIFCCPECRLKHEVKSHAIANGSGISKSTKCIFCPICEEKPLVLKSEINSDILEHIKQNHLPLQCKKCLKLYTKIEDLREISKCFLPQSSYRSEKYECEDKLKTISEASSNVNMVQTTTATQTSPLILEGNCDSRYITPTSMINLRLKTKSKISQEGFVTDSVSSIKNISSINNSSLLTKSIIGCKGAKLVRSTSTPLPTELFISKPNEQAFNASTSGQVSSIYNSGCESDGSNPPFTNQAGTPFSKQTQDLNRYRKVGSRTKMSAVTPLRQIMSKSIQKAFAEHGLSKAIHGAGGGHFRKKIFEYTDNSLFEHPISHAANAISSPLDLRLSPALRRSHSEPNPKSNIDMTDFHGISKAQMGHKILLSSKKTTTESIVITSSTQHLASVEMPKRDNSSANVISMAKPSTISISSECAETHSVHNNRNASLYQTCSSVKIIHTSTELSALNIRENSTHPDEQSTKEQQFLSACLSVPTETFDLLSKDYADHTPRTRIKGSVIKEKLIKFDTPKESVKVIQRENVPEDVFFTPDATPLRKPRLRKISPKDHEECKSQLMQEKFCGRRPFVLDCEDRIHDITDDHSDNADDEVFSLETDDHKKPEERNKKQLVANSRNLWSLMSSAIMCLPSFKGGKTTKTLGRSESLGLEACSKFILKRCASIAGSIVSSKPLAAEKPLESLKRKRTYTIDNESTTNSKYAESSSTFGCEHITASSKRFRIQARKPIDRMRLNT